MQDKLVMPLVFLHELLVDMVVLPALQADRLGLGQTGAHGKRRLGQVHGLLVLVRHKYPFHLTDAKRRPPLQAGTKRLP